MPEGGSQSPKGLESTRLSVTARRSPSEEPEGEGLTAALRVPRPGLGSLHGPCSGLQSHLCKQTLSFSLDAMSLDGGEGVEM